MEKVIKLLTKYYPVYLSGLWGTLWISAATVLFGCLLGLLVALMRMSRNKVLGAVSHVYIEVLRGTPVLLQLYFFWIGLPKLVPFELSDTQCIVAALAVNASAFISEIIRAGIGAVDKGQWEAARSIGLSEVHVMTHDQEHPSCPVQRIHLHRQGHFTGFRLFRRRADDQFQKRFERHVPGLAVSDDRGRYLLHPELCALTAPAGLGKEADGQ